MPRLVRRRPLRFSQPRGGATRRFSRRESPSAALQLPPATACSADSIAVCLAPSHPPSSTNSTTETYQLKASLAQHLGAGFVNAGGAA